MSSLDITKTIEANSDQVNADDLIDGPRTVTITGARMGSAEQPVFIELAEFPDKTFRPCKTMRRVMVAAWGADAAQYAGRRMTLFRDPAVRFGGQEIGGVRISHMSHIERRMQLALTSTRGKRAAYVVEPLAETPAPIDEATAGSLAQAIVDATDRAGLDAIAADMKAMNLGPHRDDLLAAWTARRDVLASEADQ
ncbi:hypothetical protein MYK68_16075 [Gordonia sp. PP30]|uniref:hypothetical protein n=1 Tax=Gordonia sp. PP30 TaxID=2935861 RepID=UPI001FFF686E|nr:hypothetical protein [Gordonia sp. PP30]UQE74229.1 hypothetical protein MYK68_16075 [Gordonia sp. PP30]